MDNGCGGGVRHWNVLKFQLKLCKQNNLRVSKIWFGLYKSQLSLLAAPNIQKGVKIKCSQRKKCVKKLQLDTLPSAVWKKKLFSHILHSFLMYLGKCKLSYKKFVISQWRPVITLLPLRLLHHCWSAQSGLCRWKTSVFFVFLQQALTVKPM